eukprot:jgi/Botrbrau1/21267/Bobra.39_2s0057.2
MASVESYQLQNSNAGKYNGYAGSILLSASSTLEPSTPIEQGETPFCNQGQGPALTPRSTYEGEACTPCTPHLEALANHVNNFQLDSFNRAASTKGARFARLFSARRSPKTPSRDGNVSPTSQTPSVPPMMSLDEMLVYQMETIPTSLLKLNSDNAARAVKMFSMIQRYMGETGETLGQPQRLEIIQKLLHQGIKRPELKDELYMQLLKQSRGNGTQTASNGWELFHVVASTMPPSKEFVGLVSEYVHTVAHNDGEVNMAVKAMANLTWTALKRSVKAGSRRTLPSIEEIDALLTSRRLTAIVFFLDETFEEILFDISTTVLEAVEQLAHVIKLENYQTFTLFECRRAIRPALEPGQLICDEHVILDDNKYIADVMYDFRNAKRETQSKLLFKKRMFRETDETITEPQFITLSYVQAQHDYLQGNYPVVRDDAAQMCALQMQADAGPTYLESIDTIEQAVERFITKPVLMTRPRDEWIADVSTRYRTLEQFSKEDARLQFLRILRSMPYGNSLFFSVKRIEDPIGLLPAKLILGINKRGVHFFRPVPKEYLHSAELRDIMQFGSSSQAVFFKMRVAGVLHIFQFDTKQGEDICMALQTHINDIMMKRYSKAKGMHRSEGKKENPSNSGAPDTPQVAVVNFGPKYELHMAEKQKQLDTATNLVEEMRRKEAQLVAEKSHLSESLAEAQERMQAEHDAHNRSVEKLDVAMRDAEALRTELMHARQALEKAELDRTMAIEAAVTAAVAEATAQAVHKTKQEVESAQAQAAAAQADLRAAEDAQKLGQLTTHVEALQQELLNANKELQLTTNQLGGAQKELDLLEKKLQRTEAARAAETQHLSGELDAVRTKFADLLKEKDLKFNSLVEELGNTQALLSEKEAALSEFAGGMLELEELRELKQDVDRRERAQAAVIENQAKRLEELDKLYKDEVIMRKKIYNMMEDMKGKIRVFARVRPILNFEKEKGQNLALKVMDELTLAHDWKSQKREYGFDAVYDPQASQEKVYADTSHLVQSAVDGYNVCIFAYGQTGSGKTFTIYGTDAEPGVTPRAITELFNIVDRDSGKYSYSISCYMLELYQDDLADLLLAQPKEQKGNRATAGQGSFMKSFPEKV